MATRKRVKHHRRAYINGLTLPARATIFARQAAGQLGIAMPITRAFRSGSGQAIRIPAELAYADTGTDLSITRHGDVITIFPLRQDLRAAVSRLRAMPKPSGVEQRKPIEVPDRG